MLVEGAAPKPLLNTEFHSVAARSVNAFEKQGIRLQDEQALKMLIAMLILFHTISSECFAKNHQ